MHASRAGSGLLRQPRRRRDRRVVYGTLILLPIAVWFGLMEAYNAVAPLAEPLPDSDADSIVVLPNKETLLEPSGTAGRDIFEWLDLHKSGAQLFEVGGDQFVGDTADLTAQSVGRLGRLAAMLKAHHHVRAAIIGYSATEGDAGRARSLSSMRAQNVKGELIRFGVPSERITAEGRGASNPIAPNDIAPDRQKNERVAIVLTEDAAQSHG